MPIEIHCYLIKHQFIFTSLSKEDKNVNVFLTLTNI